MAEEFDNPKRSYKFLSGDLYMDVDSEEKFNEIILDEVFDKINSLTFDNNDLTFEELVEIIRDNLNDLFGEILEHKEDDFYTIRTSTFIVPHGFGFNNVDDFEFLDHNNIKEILNDIRILSRNHGITLLMGEDNPHTKDVIELQNRRELLESFLREMTKK